MPWLSVLKPRRVYNDNHQMDALNAFYGDLRFGAGRDGWLQLTTASGPHSAFPSLPKATPFHNARDYDNYLKWIETENANQAKKRRGQTTVLP